MNEITASDKNLKDRTAARVVIRDSEGKIAIIKVHKSNYFKIPGGGVEDGEQIGDAARREAAEESGCEVRILAELGQIVTEMPSWQTRDHSFGFLAEVEGEKGAVHYEDYENERGFELIWAPSLTDAIKIFRKNEVSDQDVKLLQERDLEFLERAEKLLGTD